MMQRPLYSVLLSLCCLLLAVALVSVAAADVADQEQDGGDESNRADDKHVMKGAEPTTHHHHTRKEEQKRICQSHTDCVRVQVEKHGGNLMLDMLDFEKDTVAKIRKHLPSWFGPGPQTATFTHKGKKLEEGALLSSYGIELGDTVMMGAASGSDEL